MSESVLLFRILYTTEQDSCAEASCDSCEQPSMRAQPLCLEFLDDSDELSKQKISSSSLASSSGPDPERAIEIDTKYCTE